MSDFDPEQKRYLDGFASGVQAARLAGGLGATGNTAAAGPEPTGPDAEHLKAQDRTTAGGGKLADQEKWKRSENPFDVHARLKRQAEAGEAPKPDDNFRWRYHGLFWVAPAQTSYMCRLRLPNGILNDWQLAGLADLAERHGGGYSHVTTRANLQVREIPPEQGPALLEGLQDLGLCARGSGADNIRNVTGSPTAGIDPQELLDTRPLARAWHHHILNDRSLYGLPRKFNVAFDGGGCVAVLEETNDIGFQAVMAQGDAGEPELWMRVMLGGITGHQDLARDTGVACRPDECVAVADAIVRVFIEHGDRTNRNKARLKYVLDAWGFDKFLAAVEAKLGRTLPRLPPERLSPRPPVDRFAHLGVHPQKQAGLNWIGIVLPVGKLTADQMRRLALVAQELGDRDIRLTVWQNLLLSGIADADVAQAEARIAALGLSTRASSIRAGLVACTGATGCKFAAAHTKEDALVIAEHIEAAGLVLDVPVNIHLTGCHNSCAQHYIGDIGLIGAKVPVNAEGDTVEGYDIVVGGGFAQSAKIGREIWKGVRAEEAPARVETILRIYLAHRLGAHESFQAFTNRFETNALLALLEAPALETAA